MTENAYTPSIDELDEHATWALNSLLEAGEDVLAADFAASYEAELRTYLRLAS